MGKVLIEGKEITLDDAIIDAGVPAIKAALSIDFPTLENADVQIVRPATAGAPRTATVVKRGTGKGAGDIVPGHLFMTNIIQDLLAAPAHQNPAIALAQELMRAETMGNTADIDRRIRSGEIERAIITGETEGRAVMQALHACGHASPVAAKEVPIGF